ncbi:MAG: hypothetical protein K2Y37_25185 [Pirellulales bacterium]|nr:hypothetical protein [Pirellulales bacterium]
MSSIGESAFVAADFSDFTASLPGASQTSHIDSSQLKVVGGAASWGGSAGNVKFDIPPTPGYSGSTSFAVTFNLVEASKLLVGVSLSASGSGMPPATAGFSLVDNANALIVGNSIGGFSDGSLNNTYTLYLPAGQYSLSAAATTAGIFPPFGSFPGGVAGGSFSLDLTATPVPEPPAGVLLFVGFVTLLVCSSKHSIQLLAFARRWQRLVSILVVVCCVLNTSRPTKAASFQGLSDLPGGAFSSRANSVSADGTTVVGAGNVDVTKTYSNGEAFRWTASTGMVGLGDFPDSNLNPNGRGSYAFGVSGDGSIVVGSGSSPEAIPVQAFRWTDPTGIEGLGYLTAEPYSEGFAISADGSTIVGTGRSYEAFRWTQPTGMVGLGGLPGGDGSSGARAVSADGSVIAGGAKSALGNEPFIWTQATGMVGLGNLAGGTYLDASALGISPEGNVIVGFSNSSNAPSPLYEAFRWTQATGMVGLSDLPGGTFLSEASATSSNGEVVVGYGTTDTGQAAFIWDSAYGMRNLQQVLVDLGSGGELTGWNLLNATGVSADGRTIVGYGTNPDGNTEAWIATVPEPSTLVLAAIALLVICVSLTARRAERGRW